MLLQVYVPFAAVREGNSFDGKRAYLLRGLPRGIDVRLVLTMYCRAASQLVSGYPWVIRRFGTNAAADSTLLVQQYHP